MKQFVFKSGFWKDNRLSRLAVKIGRHNAIASIIMFSELYDKVFKKNKAGVDKDCNDLENIQYIKDLIDFDYVKEIDGKLYFIDSLRILTQEEEHKRERMNERNEMIRKFYDSYHLLYKLRYKIAPVIDFATVRKNIDKIKDDQIDPYLKQYFSMDSESRHSHCIPFFFNIINKVALIVAGLDDKTERKTIKTFAQQREENNKKALSDLLNERRMSMGSK